MNSKKNIILTWASWSWKTTLWKRLAAKSWYEFIDFDDDILEKISLKTAEQIIDILEIKNINPIQIVEKTVWEILSILWDEDFMRLENYLALQIKFDKSTILSTSWSLPLNSEAMNYLMENWTSIYLETPLKDISWDRFDRMKTERIVWMTKDSKNRDLYLEIMQKRRDSYEKYSHIKYIPQMWEKPMISNKYWIPILSEYWVKTIDKEKDKQQNFDNFYKFLKDKWIVEF